MTGAVGSGSRAAAGRTARVSLPAGTVTFIFTDVEGSTRMLDELGAEQYAAALAEHRRALRDAFEARGGVEVDTQGDALFFAFVTAPDALAAASAGQAALAEGPIRVRIGMHTGTPLLTDEGYVGADVHRAARIAAAGHGGQVLVSSSTAALVSGVELRDLGQHRFKDLAAAERVYQLGDGEFPPLKSLYRTNLPVPATPFLGRAEELASVVELLNREEVRLLTLSGPGGTGKTRLALQAVAEAADVFPDGMTWVPLAPLREASLGGTAVARALGVREQPGIEPLEAVIDALWGKAALLLLDNAEHLLPKVADVVARLAAADGPTVLVTSRERLRVQGEQVWPVPELAPGDAVELFLAQARRVDPGFQPSAAVDELCARLDHLPLAIELAAARTAVFSPEQVLERIGQRLDLLKGPRDADPRQITLRNTIGWSYELLHAEEQALFRALSVFAGGCTFDAAEQVGGATPDSLQSLLDKSLVRHREAAGVRRYYMLESIREFAGEQLDRSGLAQDVRLRHARFFDALGERLLTEVGDYTPLDIEFDNLRVAVDEAARLGQPLLRLGLATALGATAEVFGQAGELRAKLQAALTAAGNAPAALRGRAQLRLGVLSYMQADLAAARRSFQESLESSRTAEDESGAGRALTMLGATVAYEGDRVAGRRLAEEGREIFLRQGNMAAAAWADNTIGLSLIQERDFRGADAVLEGALEQGPHRGLRGIILVNLGLSALLASRPKEAAIRYRTALEDLHDPISVEHACFGLEGLAASWSAQQTHLFEAATLLAAAATTRAGTGTQPIANERELVEHATAEARRLLPDERYAAAIAAGSTMPIDEAVEYALAVE